MINEEETAKETLERIASTDDLYKAIKRLELRKDLLEQDLKDEFHIVLETLKPSNILKNTIHEVQASTELKNNLLKVALGLGAGYFSRKLVIGKSAGIVKKALGTALQYGITNFVAKRNRKNDEENESPVSYSKGKSLLKRIFSI